MLEKCKKLFFCFQNTCNLPSNLSQSSLGQNRMWYHNVISHCVPQCNIKYGKDTQFDVTNNFASDKQGPSLRVKFGGKLCIFWKQQNAFYIFPALLKLRNVFYRYPTTRNKGKNFRVICISLCLLFIGSNKLQVRNLRMQGPTLVGQYKVNQNIQPQRYTISNGPKG